MRRMLPFRSGDVLIPDKLLDGQRRLGDFAAFDSVSVDPLRPPPNPFADVEVTLRERKPWHLDFGLGYSNADGARGFIELGHDDVFGTGASVSIRQRLSAGGDSTRWAERTDVLGRLPFVLGTPWWVDVDIFQECERAARLRPRSTPASGSTPTATLFPEPIKGLRGDLRYRLESVRYSNVDPTLARRTSRPGRQFISSVTPVLTLDRRDEPLDPTRGSFHQISVETGAGVLGSDVQFVKGWLETRWFFNWPPPTVIAMAGRLGLAAPYGGTSALVIQDRFFAGGATTVRGFRQDRLGPLDANGNPTGGNATAILNLEWRFPIWRWFGGALFVDTGTVTPEISDLNLERVQDGSGRRAPHQDAGRPHPLRRGLRASAHLRGVADPVSTSPWGTRSDARAWLVARRARPARDRRSAATPPTSASWTRCSRRSTRVPVMLSDVALARALGVLGLEPSAGPITDAELARYLDAQLAVREATQLDIEVPAADVDRAWESAGGAVLAARLEAVGIDPAWARRLLEADLRVERFIDLRFRAFAFVTDFDVDEALGPGSHDEATRARTRDRLRADMVARAFAAWKTDARQRVPIRRVPGVTGPWPRPSRSVRNPAGSETGPTLIRGAPRPMLREGGGGGGLDRPPPEGLSG